jgi:tetratricopeptide (TPR) repeat protein
VCEKESGDTEKALDYFEKLVNDYGSDPLAPDASLQAGILLEKLDRFDDALRAYEFTKKSKNQDLGAEAAFYHADIYKQTKRYDNAIKEFESLIVTYPEQDQWVVTAYAKVAECYEEQKKYQKAADTYNRILKYTKVKAFRTATLKRLKALQPFLHPVKKKVPKPDPVPAEPEVDR